MAATALWSIVLIAPQRGQRPRALRLQHTVAVTPITRELALAEQGKVYVSERFVAKSPRSASNFSCVTPRDLQQFRRFSAYRRHPVGRH